MNMQFFRKLPIPQDVKAEYPVSDEMAAIKRVRDEEIKAVFNGESDKFLLVIGPCSADHRDPVLEYISRLCRIQEQVKDKIIIIPRIYTNKPRTTGEGYKGMLHQPDPDEKPDLYKGLVEMLYPENHRYLSDLLAYVAVGARSVENQQHRLTASGLNIPVGMKNPTGGDISVMINSIKAAQHGHTFIYRGWEVKSEGNQYAHAILRGYLDFAGKSVSNYHYEDVLRLSDAYAESGLTNPAVIIDTNHNNSGKRYLEQIRIANEVVDNRNINEDIRRLVKGLMIESYLVDGKQDVHGTVFGQSITDPCLGWEKTEQLILQLAEKL